MHDNQVDRPAAPQFNQAMKQRNRVRPTGHAYQYGVAGRQHVVTADGCLNRRQELMVSSKHDTLVKSVLQTTLSILGDRHLRYSALKNANCLRVLARVLAF
jgi:hypothetical protein